MTNLFQTIINLTPRLHGWATVEKALTIASTIIALRPERCLEIGVWGGRSIFPAALACKEIGKGHCVAVDPWVAVASVQGQTGANFQWWETQNHELVYRDFLEKRGELGLNDIITVQRMISDYYEPQGEVGWCHLDGNHGPQAFKDAQRFGPIVSLGGFCFLDDLAWEGGYVLKALDHLRGIGFKELYKLDTGIMLQKVR